MENTFKGLLLPTPIEAKTVSLNNPREKYPAAIKHLFSNLKVKLFKRMKTADTSPLLSLDSSVQMNHDQINPHICNPLFYKAMNKLHYHTMEISEFQLDQKFISSVPSTLQITAPKLCSIPSVSCSTHFSAVLQ